jgi:hypothetical protein
MTIKLASLKTDLAADTAGDWVDYPDWPGVAFKVSSTNLPAFAAARSQMLSRHARKNAGALQLDDASPEYGALYAKHLLHGWRGLDVEYTPEKATAILLDPEYRSVTAAIAWCAQRASIVDAEFVETEAKNSVNSASSA